MRQEQQITSGLYFAIKFYKNNKVVRMYTLRRKRAFIQRVEADFQQIRPDKAFLRVTYNGTNSNEGEYFTKKSLLFAYRAFTEQSLIKDLL